MDAHEDCILPREISHQSMRRRMQLVSHDTHHFVRPRLLKVLDLSISAIATSRARTMRSKAMRQRCPLLRINHPRAHTCAIQMHVYHGKGHHRCAAHARSRASLPSGERNAV